MTTGATGNEDRHRQSESRNGRKIAMLRSLIQLSTAPKSNATGKERALAEHAEQGTKHSPTEKRKHLPRVAKLAPALEKVEWWVKRRLIHLRPKFGWTEEFHHCAVR